MTGRLATCRELAEDKGAITRLSGHYWNLEKSATLVSVLLPWFLGSAKTKAKVTMGLYTLFSLLFDSVVVPRHLPWTQSTILSVKAFGW